jgi:integrase
MVLLAGSTGLRRGELIALRWRDIDFVTMQANVTHSVWHNVEGDTKTEASRKPVPLHTVVIEDLKSWRLATLYRSDDDYLFPSIAKNGSQPIQPDMILKRHIRPALERLRVKKRIGWHSFRHGLATMLRQKGVDIKTAQELLRLRSTFTSRQYRRRSGLPPGWPSRDCSKPLILSTLQHPRRPPERRGHYRKLLVLSNLW